MHIYLSSYLDQEAANLSSGVPRVPCALRQEIFLRLPSTKLTEFELKNRCKSTEKTNPECPICCIVTWFFFERNKMHLTLETNSTKL